MADQVVGAVEQQGGTLETAPVGIDRGPLHRSGDHAAVDASVADELKQPVCPFKIANAEVGRAVRPLKALAPFVCVQGVQRAHVLWLGQGWELSPSRTDDDAIRAVVSGNDLRRSRTPCVTNDDDRTGASVIDQRHRSLSEFLERVGSVGRRAATDAGDIEADHTTRAEQCRNDMVPGVQTLACAVQQEERALTVAFNQGMDGADVNRHAPEPFPVANIAGGATRSIADRFGAV